MVYVPRNSEWYVAEIIEEIRVEGDDRNVVHKNLVVIKAGSPDMAYLRALELGRESESSYQNPEGQTVKSQFRGLGYLDVVHGDLEDGTELLYISKVAVAEEEILKWVRPKEELELFNDAPEVVDQPDFSSKEVRDQAIRIVEQNLKPEG